MDQQDPQDPQTDPRDPRVQPEHWEFRALPDLLEIKALLVQRAQLVALAQQVRQEIKGLWVTTDLLDHRAFKAYRAFRALRDPLAHKAFRVLLALQEHKAHKA